MLQPWRPAHKISSWGPGPWTMAIRPIGRIQALEFQYKLWRIRTIFNQGPTPAMFGVHSLLARVAEQRGDRSENPPGNPPRHSTPIQTFIAEIALDQGGDCGAVCPMPACPRNPPMSAKPMGNGRGARGRQRELVDRLAGQGLDTSEAKTLLDVMETVLERMRDHRPRIPQGLEP